MTRSQARSFVLLMPVLACVAAAGSAQGGYTATELGPLATAIGSMTTISGYSMNNLGQVVGVAVLPGDGRRAAFFYSEDTGMIDLDPDGDYFSEALAINDQRWIYGLRRINRAPLPFLYDAELRLDRLRKNRSKILGGLSPFSFWDLNSFGVLVGCGADCTKPVLYARDGGWMDLSEVDPRFRARPTVARLINDLGDLVFTIGHPGGFQQSFVLLNGEELVELGHFGTLVNVPTEINNSRVISGISRTAGSDPNVQADGDDHAYLYTQSEGVEDIHRKRFRSSYALGVTADGVVVGGARRRGTTRGADTLFTYDVARGSRSGRGLLQPARQGRGLRARSGLTRGPQASAVLLSTAWTGAGGSSTGVRRDWLWWLDFAARGRQRPGPDSAGGGPARHRRSGDLGWRYRDPHARRLSEHAGARRAFQPAT